jgi:hypothetical protein
MSATHDKNQNVIFAFGPIKKVPQYSSSRVLKVENLNASDSPVSVKSFVPTQIKAEIKPQITQIIESETKSEMTQTEAPVSTQAAVSASAPQAVLESLKQNLKSLNDLHSRLRFMLEEIEDLVRE